MIAASIALVIVLGIFAVVQQASKQTSSVDKKMQQHQLITDLRFLLGNRVLCNDFLKIPKFEPGQDVSLRLDKKFVVEKDTLLPKYAMKVDDFKTTSAVLYSVNQSYKAPDGKQKYESYELKGGKLVRVNAENEADNGKPYRPMMKALLETRTSRWYFDLELKLSAVAGGHTPYKPVQLSRISMSHREMKMQPDRIECDESNVAPATTKVKLDLEAVNVEGDVNFNYGTSGGSSAPAPSHAGTGDTARPAPVSAPEPAAPSTAAPASERSCPLVGDAGMAVHGHKVFVPIGNCMQRAFLCWNGNLDPVGEPERMASCDDGIRSDGPNGIIGNHGKSPYAALEGGCAFRMSATEAVRTGNPTYKNGEQVLLQLDHCTEQTMLCMNGVLEQVGAPRRRDVPDCPQ